MIDFARLFDCSDSRICVDGGDYGRWFFNQWVLELKRRYGNPLGCGGSRIVWLDPERPSYEYVIKFPYNHRGILDNRQQLDYSGVVEDDGTEFAWCEEHKELTEETGVLVLRMEYAQTLPYSRVPDWAYNFDMQQVGLTKDERIVLYDI
jgi:hypothetical protein